MERAAMRPELGERPIIYGICHLRRREGAGGKSPGPSRAPWRVGASIVTVQRCRPDATIAVPILTAAAPSNCLPGAVTVTPRRLRAHGFSIDMMVELVKAGLATTKRERMVAGGRQTDVVRVRITEAGRQALAKMSK